MVNLQKVNLNIKMTKNALVGVFSQLTISKLTISDSIAEQFLSFTLSLC